MTAQKQPKKEKKIVYLVGVIADQDDAWELVAKKTCKAQQFTLPIPGDVFNKEAVKFLNGNLTRFLVMADSLPEGVSHQN